MITVEFRSFELEKFGTLAEAQEAVKRYKNTTGDIIKIDGSLSQHEVDPAIEPNWRERFTIVSN